MPQVLLVQPERIFLTMFAHALRGAEYDVYAADNEAAALECVRNVQPDLIVCGFLMGPSSTELEMVQRLREAVGAAPIVVVSSGGLAPVLDSGASLLVSHSMNGSALAELVDGIVESLNLQRPERRRARTGAGFAHELSRLPTWADAEAHV